MSYTVGSYALVWQHNTEWITHNSWDHFACDEHCQPTPLVVKVTALNSPESIAAYKANAHGAAILSTFNLEWQRLARSGHVDECYGAEWRRAIRDWLATPDCTMGARKWLLDWSTTNNRIA